MKTKNRFAEQTVTQINTTLDMLLEKHLLITYNIVDHKDNSNGECQITWKNHNMSRNNSGEMFTKLDQYLFILKNNSYHCLLFDGSIIRVNFQFDNNILLSQNLLWWPSPYDYHDLLQEGYSPVDLIEDFYNDSQWYKVIKMRSPIRIDFDYKKNTEEHSKSHLHIQHENTRLVIEQPLCFNRFIDFLFRNFYIDYNVEFSFHDYINYKTPDSKDVEYLFSKINI